jgi:hypothetical protein
MKRATVGNNVVNAKLDGATVGLRDDSSVPGAEVGNAVGLVVPEVNGVPVTAGSKTVGKRVVVVATGTADGLSLMIRVLLQLLHVLRHKSYTSLPSTQIVAAMNGRVDNHKQSLFPCIGLTKKSIPITSGIPQTVVGACVVDGNTVATSDDRRVGNCEGDAVVGGLLPRIVGRSDDSGVPVLPSPFLTVIVGNNVKVISDGGSVGGIASDTGDALVVVAGADVGLDCVIDPVGAAVGVIVLSKSSTVSLGESFALDRVLLELLSLLLDATIPPTATATATKRTKTSVRMIQCQRQNFLKKGCCCVASGLTYGGSAPASREAGDVPPTDFNPTVSGVSTLLCPLDCLMPLDPGTTTTLDGNVPALAVYGVD